MAKIYFGWEVDEILPELDYYPDKSDRLNDFIHSIVKNNLNKLYIYNHI